MKKIVIIGAGPGGYYTALCLGHADFDITLIDKEYAGGTCLNIGCIPTKVLLDHTSLFEHFQESVNKKKIFNLSGSISINPEVLRRYQLEVINQLKFGLEKLFKSKKINFIYGEASFISPKKILVVGKNDKLEIDADYIVIATGSKPKSIPGFTFDKKLVVSSDDVWSIPIVPKKLLIVGSGPIGIEFARIFNLLGSSVTIAEIQDRMCPLLDAEISENLLRSLKRRGIATKPNVASKFISKENNEVKVEFLSTKDNTCEQNTFDQVLIAIGREPNAGNLCAEKAQIDLEPHGFIKVNEYLETNVKDVWAIGDVTNYPQLAHTASFQARVVTENILGGKKKVFDGSFIPSCIFGYPEIAFVGETEDSLKLKGKNYKAGKFLFLASGKAKASGLTEGLVKILMDKDTKKILGAHIIGPEASNLIHELVIAMQNNLTVEQVTHSIHAHPTYSEVVLEALEDCLGKAVHV